MSRIIDWAIANSRVVITTLILLVAIGAYAYVAIPKEANPDVNIPVVYVSMTLPGVSPEDAERLLVRPMEQELGQLGGVDEMTSTAYLGGGNVTLEFDAGSDIDEALADVREAVDRVKPDLPDEAEEPRVDEVNFSLFPVLVVALSGEVPERTLIELGNELADKIETIPEVLWVDIGGDREEMVEITVDPLLVESYGLDAYQVLNLVSRSNRLVAAGVLDTGQGSFAVKVPGLFEDLDDILDLPLRAEGDAVVRFRDIAEIRRTYKDPEGFARVNGLPAVTLEVVKRSGENVIDTIDEVRALVEAERAFWPETLQVTYSQDQSEDVKVMLADLQNGVIAAILLVMVVLVGALGLRSALLVGIAIPSSFLTGILALYAFGLSTNIVVLFGLILVVGMLVDGAVVVTEYADRKMAEGLDRRAAYALSAKRMAGPVIASITTHLAAFIPLLFWPGIVGQFMQYLPITLICTMTASLVVALVFLPTIGAYFGAPGHADSEAMKALAASESGDLRHLRGFTGWYVRVLERALRHPGAVVGGAGAVLVAIWLLYGMAGNGVEFFPAVEPARANVLVHARGNLSIEEKDALMREVEGRILPLRDEIDSIYTRTGLSQQGGQNAGEDVIGQITLEFADWDERRKADDILQDIRDRTADLAGIAIETRQEEGGPPVGKPIQIQLSAPDPDRLPAAAETIRRHLATVSGLVDIEDSRPMPGIEWQLDVDRAEAAKYGLDLTAVGDTVRLVTRGFALGATRFDDADDEVDIIVRYPEEWRTLDQLEALRINTPNGPVPISNFVEIRPTERVGTLRRVDGERVMTVQADVAPGVLPAEKVAEIQAWLPTAGLDPAIDVTFRGEDEEQQAAATFLQQAFLGALFLIASILLLEFNSFYSVLLVLSAVVMSTVGVLVGLMITGQTFGIVMTGIGVIALAGIIVSNNIILIDTYDRLKETAPTATEAILRTGAQRLRPVLLTVITAVIGLLPMATAVTIDFMKREVTVGAPSAQWWVQLSTAIIFGLVFATVLTLVITPCALQLKADVAAWRARRRAAPAARRAAARPAFEGEYAPAE